MVVLMAGLYVGGGTAYGARVGGGGGWALNPMPPADASLSSPIPDSLEALSSPNGPPRMPARWWLVVPHSADKQRDGM